MGEGISGWWVIEVETDLALDDTDRGVGCGWAPEAKVIDTVDDGGLAERILAGGLKKGGKAKYRDKHEEASEGSEMRTDSRVADVVAIL